MGRDLTGQNHHITYVEISVTDIERAKGFYGAAFGWTFKDYGPDYCEFFDGGLQGGFARVEVVTTGGPLLVLCSENLDFSQRAVEAAGGKIEKPVLEFPGGKRFYFIDPDGNELAIWTKA